MKTLVIFSAIFFAVQFQDHCGGRESVKPDAKNKQSTPVKKMSEQKFEDLPDGISLTDEVKREIKNADGGSTIELISVAEALRQVGAHYSGEKLVDENDREIKFYKPPVRGTSQGFEEDRLQRERDEKELLELRSKYTVIVIYQNPLKVM